MLFAETCEYSVNMYIIDKHIGSRKIAHQSIFKMLYIFYIISYQYVKNLH